MSLHWTILAPAYDRMSRMSEQAGLGAMREGLLSDAAAVAAGHVEALPGTMA